MKLYVFPHSPYSRKVLVAAYEKGVEILQEIVAPYDAAATARLKALCPAGTVPVLVRDDGRAMGESSIIVEYLDIAFPSERRLLPPDPMAALGARAFDRLGDGLLAATAYLAFSLAKPASAQNPSRILSHQHKVRTALDELDGALRAADYLTGDALTFADLGPVCAVASLLSDRSLPSLEPWPHVAQWLARVCARPSWQRVLRESAAVPLPPGLQPR